MILPRPSPISDGIENSPRPSARVGKVAQMLDCDESQIRRMIKSGQLTGHRIGKRGWRIFLDSVAEFQTHGGAPLAPRYSTRDNKSVSQPSRACRRAHAQAMAELQKAGVL